MMSDDVRKKLKIMMKLIFFKRHMHHHFFWVFTNQSLVINQSRQKKSIVLKFREDQ